MKSEEMGVIDLDVPLSITIGSSYLSLLKLKNCRSLNSQTLPFEKYPNRLIVETVYNAIFWLNCFPHKNGIHPTLSPRTIITGSTIDYNKHCNLQFGTYAQVHEPHNNSLLPRTTGAIALRPSGNIQGGYFFLSLTTGKRIIRNKWTILPMPAEVIATVHQLAAACKKYKGIVFTDKNGNVINDTNDDEANDTLEITGVDNETGNDTNYNTVEITGVPENDTPITGMSVNDTPITEVSENYTPTEYTTPPEITGVARNLEHTETGTENDIAQDMNYEQNSTGQYHDAHYEQDDDDVSIENETPEDIHVTINDMNAVHEMNAGQLNVNPDTGEEIEEESEVSRHGYNLCPRPTKRKQMYNMTNMGQQSTIAKPHLHVMLNQVGIREGLKMFGEEGNNALLKELNQLHERDALLPKKKEDMMHDERKKALRVFNVFKRKKGRNHQGERMC